MSKVAARLRSAREKAGLSLRAMAERLGISPTHLSRVENGYNVPSETVLKDLCKLTGADFDSLMRCRGRVPTDVLKYIVRTPGVLERLRKEMAA